MTDYGTIVNVWVATLGDELTANTSIGATSITVVDPADFNEDGGVFLLGAETIAYSAVDDETGIITCTALASAHTAGDRVDYYPVGQEKWANVIVDDDVEAIPVRVPHALWDRIPEGTRVGVGESIAFADVDDEMVVTDVLGAMLLIDGAYLDPDATVPPLALSDGLPPAASGIPEVTGLPRLLIAKIDGVVNHDAMSYEWHISTATAAPTFGGATAHHADGSTMVALTTLADGVTALVYDTTYYVGVFAYDIDGAAAFSGWSTGTQLDPNGTADIAVGGILAANIDVVDLLANGIRTADSGQRVTLSTAEGFAVIDSAENIRVSFPTTSDDLKINADLATESLTVNGGLTLRGADNVFAKESVITLESAISTPQPSAAAVVGWPSITLPLVVGQEAPYRRGLYYYSANWWVGFTATGGGFIKSFDPVTGVDTGLGFALPSGYQPEGGLTHMVIGGNQRWMVLCRKDSDATWWMLTLTDIGTLSLAWQWSDGVDGRGAAIHSDGTTLVYIAQRDTSNSYKVRAYSPTGTFSSTVACAATVGSPTDSEVNGIYYGAADFGATRIALSLRQDKQIRVFNTSGTEQSNVSFKAAYDERAAGLAWDGSNFYTATMATGKASIYKYSDIFKTSALLSVWPAYTWYDADATGGTHETAMSPQVSKVVGRRQSITVTTPTIPDAGGTDDPDTVKLYVGYKATTPTRTEMWLHTTPAAGVTTATLQTQVTSGTNPPAANNFPGAIPAVIKDSVGNEILSGNSAWTAYTPTWGSTGTAPGLVNGTLTGKWKRHGNDIHFKIWMSIGPATTIGTGNYTWTLPVPAVALAETVGYAFYDDITATKYGGITVATITSTSTVGAWLTSTGRLSATNPVVPANGDIYSINGTYEAA